MFGFHGCGKTTFGKKLASILTLDFLDTDKLIEDNQKLSCRELFKQKGEKIFRSLEEQIIESLDANNSVIALGGGTILNDKNYQKLKQLGLLIYLEVDKEILKERMLKNGLPAYLKDLESFDYLYNERKCIYEKCCQLKIPVSNS